MRAVHHSGRYPLWTLLIGLGRLADRLHPGGVFGLWSDGAPDPEFVAVMDDVFASCEAHVVSFPNFYTGGESASTVYVAMVGA